MIVKEILLNALANSGRIHDGDPAEAEDLTLALRLFNTEMKYYSGKNLVTAYQDVLDIPEAKDSQLIGSYVPKKGVEIHECDALPSADEMSKKFVAGRDFWLVVPEMSTFTLSKVESPIYEAWHWVPVTDNFPYNIFPDVLCKGIEKIVSVMYRNEMNKWENLRFSPLSKFFTDNDPFAYCSQNAGENKVKLILDVSMIGKEIRIIYNSSMDFKKFDVIELPDMHIALIEIALTVALLRHDADTDSTRLNNYTEQLDNIMQDIMSTTSTERRIQRSTESVVERLHGGTFIMRRGV